MKSMKGMKVGLRVFFMIFMLLSIVWFYYQGMNWYSFANIS